MNTFPSLFVLEAKTYSHTSSCLGHELDLVVEPADGPVRTHKLHQEGPSAGVQEHDQGGGDQGVIRKHPLSLFLSFFRLSPFSQSLPFRPRLTLSFDCPTQGVLHPRASEHRLGGQLLERSHEPAALH
jgi:hypothetical protein